MPPTADLTTNRGGIFYSKRFDEGYGDFAMRSSDKVIFYFPKMLLEYASPFFKDMFSISGHAKDVNPINHTEPLDMEEDSETLEDLLQYIDPVQLMPLINAGTTPKFLRAAHKYQIEKVLEWFSREAMGGVDIPCLVDGHRSVISTQPMLVLSLAEQYNLTELARLALRQLIIEPANTLLVDDTNISLKLWLHLYRLRKERVDWYLASFDRFSCLYQYLAAWTRKVHDSPRWTSVEKEFSKLTNCHGCSQIRYNNNTASTYSELAQWKADAKSLERELPPLPKGILGT